MSVSSVGRLSHYFEILNKKFGQPVNLNKTEPDYSIYGSTKGVESDFIRIYKFGLISGKTISKNIECSFAFSFSNPENAKNSLVTITLKENEKITKGYTYNIEEMKQKLKEFIKEIDEIKDKNTKHIMESILKTFDFDKQVSKDLELTKAAKLKIDTLLIELSNKEKLFEDKYNELRIENYEAQSKYDTFKNKRIKDFGILELEKKLKELRKELDNELKEKNKEVKLDVLNKDLFEYKSKLNSIKNKKDSTIKEVLKIYSSDIKIKVMEELQKDKLIKRTQTKLVEENNEIGM